jgi:hypothetical protein
VCPNVHSIARSFVVRPQIFCQGTKCLAESSSGFISRAMAVLDHRSLLAAARVEAFVGVVRSDGESSLFSVTHFRYHPTAERSQPRIALGLVVFWMGFHPPTIGLIA